MIAVLSLLACLDPISKDGTDGTDSGDTGATGGGSTIFDVRDGTVGDGETVTLSGILVSSPLTRADSESGKSDGFFVQDPAGGENSGLYVWSQGQFGSELTIEPGDEVSISGKISEFYDWTELVVGDASAITVTGSGTLPAPANLGDGAGVDWNVWESVPVTLENQTVESVNSFGTGLLSAGISVDDGFVYNDYDCRGSFASVTGIIFYRNYDEEVTTDDWSVNDRTTDELAGYTPGEVIDTTVHGIRADGICGPVHVSGVVSTAASFGEKDERTYLFVQDAGGGENSGIVVFNPDGYTGYYPGSVFDVTGTVSDYFGLAEISLFGGGTITETGNAQPTITTVPADVTDWLPWQSALIRLDDVTALNVDEWGTVLTDRGVYIDNLFMDVEAEEGSSWSSVTGPLFYTSYDDVPQFLVEPRSADDLVE